MSAACVPRGAAECINVPSLFLRAARAPQSAKIAANTSAKASIAVAALYRCRSGVPAMFLCHREFCNATSQCSLMRSAASRHHA